MPQEFEAKKMQERAKLQKSDCRGVSAYQTLTEPLHGININHFILSIARQVAEVACLGLTYFDNN